MSKRIKTVVLALLLVLAGAQFVRPSRANPPVDPAQTLRARTAVSPEVMAAIERGCRDCHSSDTAWPWYTNVAPLSWWIADHVAEARGKFNYSAWGGLSPERARETLEDVCKEVTEGGMPLPSYLIVHRAARLTPADVQAICAWTEAERARLGGAHTND